MVTSAADAVSVSSSLLPPRTQKTLGGRRSDGGCTGLGRHLVVEVTIAPSVVRVSLECLSGRGGEGALLFEVEHFEIVDEHKSHYPESSSFTICYLSSLPPFLYL